MLERLKAWPSVVYLLLIVMGTSWFLWALMVWPWQRYWALKLFRSNYWRRAKASKREMAYNEKIARAVARSQTWRVITAISGFAVIALGVLGLVMRR
jgi:hypothetical protein